MIEGNSGINVLAGIDGDDVLSGRGGDDRISGGAGNDPLDGGSGADLMNGGAGNDLYKVDNAGDRIIEAIGGGNDRVETTVSYALEAGREIETLAANDAALTRAIDLTGNAFANLLIGNAGANMLDGGDGDDVLIGGAGADQLAGDAGADRFVYETVADSGLTDTTRDTITGFVSGQDHIDLSLIDARPSSGSNNAFTFIGAHAFMREGQVRAYQSGGNTFIELNVAGTTAADSTVALQGAYNLTAADFIL